MSQDGGTPEDPGPRQASWEVTTTHHRSKQGLGFEVVRKLAPAGHQVWIGAVYGAREHPEEDVTQILVAGWL